MTSKDIVRHFFALSEAGKTEECFALFSEDLQWTNHGSSSLSGTYNGKPEVMSALLGPLFSTLKAGIQMQIEDMTAEGSKVVVQAKGFAETKDGIPYNNTYCMIFEIRDNSIVAVEEYSDTLLIESVFGSGL
ncbi:nuclear transport factor 2 family protein [Alteromonas sp. CYL-A6]|uniref:nuclear transport factor 2 family protein n=1 Tax=Alteromonas nitratireducens TaxID=3390813 RepID=UPI0034AF7A6B